MNIQSYLYLYTYRCIYIHSFLSIYIYINACVHVYLHICVWVCVCRTRCVGFLCVSFDTHIHCNISYIRCNDLQHASDTRSSSIVELSLIKELVGGRSRSSHKPYSRYRCELLFAPSRLQGTIATDDRRPADSTAWTFAVYHNILFHRGVLWAREMLAAEHPWALLFFPET